MSKVVMTSKREVFVILMFSNLIKKVLNLNYIDF